MGQYGRPPLATAGFLVFIQIQAFVLDQCACYECFAVCAYVCSHRFCQQTSDTLPSRAAHGAVSGREVSNYQQQNVGCSAAFSAGS